MSSDAASKTAARGGLSGIEELGNMEVVRTHITSSFTKPKVTLNMNAIRFNKACLDLFPDNEYVQVLMDRARKRLVLLPCKPYTKDALKWCTVKNGKHMSKDCLARIFGAKVYDMMDWVKDNRYKSVAIYQEIQNYKLIVFNLEESEMTVPEYITREDGKKIKKSRSYLPDDWRDTFGLTLKQHQESVRVDLDANYMLTDMDKPKGGDGAVDGKAPAEEEIIMSQYRENASPSVGGKEGVA